MFVPIFFFNGYIWSSRFGGAKLTRSRCLHSPLRSLPPEFAHLHHLWFLWSHFLGQWFIFVLDFFCTFESNLRYIFGVLKHEERFCFRGYLFGQPNKILSILERHISISGMFRWTNSFWCRRFESPLEMKICSFTFFCNTTDGRKRSSSYECKRSSFTS